MEPESTNRIGPSPHFDRNILYQLSHAHEGLVRTIYQRLNPSDVEFPRFVVAGNRFSGKSSVLEGLTRLQFPTQTTRFATTVAFRPFCQDGLNITIRNSNDHQILPPVHVDGNMPLIVEEATRYLRNRVAEESHKDPFWNETLRIQLSSPNYIPHITFVDLPGLQHGTPSQDSAIPRLYKKFLKHPCTIILAVISAQNPHEFREVLDEVKKYDPNLERTIGILTKPDAIEGTSLESQQLCLSLIQNAVTSYHLVLGWHVVRNRNRARNQHFDVDEVLHERELSFLRAGLWSVVDSKDQGVKALREKLSQVFASRVRWKNPAAVSDLQHHLQQDQASLSQRKNILKIQTKDHLVKISSDFKKLVVDALHGNYSDARFGSHPRLKLRSDLGKLNFAFSSIMLEKGKNLDIVWGDEPDLRYRKRCERIHPSVRDCYNFPDAIAIPIEDLQYMSEAFAYRGASTAQASSEVKEKLSVTLFRYQSLPWESIATTHFGNVLRLVEAFVRELLPVLTGNNFGMTEAITQQYLLPFLLAKGNVMRHKVQELLHHYRTADDPLCEDLWGPVGGQKSNQRRLKRNVSTADAKYLFEREVENMQGHYERAVRVFIENIATLAVESCIIRELPSIFTPDMINSLNYEGTIALSGQLTDEETALIRDFEKGIQDLEETLDICRQYFNQEKQRECVGLLAAGGGQITPTIPVIRLIPPTLPPTPLVDTSSSQKHDWGGYPSPVSPNTDQGSALSEANHLSVAYRPPSRASSASECDDEDMSNYNERDECHEDNPNRKSGNSNHDNHPFTLDLVFTDEELLAGMDEQSFVIPEQLMAEMPQFVTNSPSGTNKRPRESDRDDDKRHKYTIQNGQWTRVEHPGYGFT